MARHTRTITIEDEGRDKGKVFILTEMPATAAEKWATQVGYLLSQAGISEGAKAQESGMAGLASIPLESVASLKALQDPSLDAWWECVRYQHRADQMPQPILQGEACQIEEIATVQRLRIAVLELHVGFFSAESASTSVSSSTRRPTVPSVTRTSRAS